MSLNDPSEQIITHAETADVGEVFPIDSLSVAIITRLSATPEHQNYTGNVSRRLCRLGGPACPEVCQLRADLQVDNPDRLCANNNLLDSLQALGIDPEQFLLVGVTDNKVGFADAVRPEQTTNGYSAVSGFNAFYDRTKEKPALGELLADCACLVIRMTDEQGQSVTGIMHGTKVNLRGPSKFEFPGPDDTKVSWTQHTLWQGMQYYRAEPASVHLRLLSSIRPEHYGYNFTSREAMEEEQQLPGLYEAGYIYKVEGEPDWQAKDAATQSWQIDFRRVITDNIHEAMAALGITSEQFTDEGQIDPADTNGAHSSHHTALRRGEPDSRNLYLVYGPEALK